MSSNWTEWTGPRVARCSLCVRGDEEVDFEMEDLMEQQSMSVLSVSRSCRRGFKRSPSQ